MHRLIIFILGGGGGRGNDPATGVPDEIKLALVGYWLLNINHFDPFQTGLIGRSKI